MDIEFIICAISSPWRWAALCAGWYRVAETTEVRLFPLAHQLKVQRLLAEVALRRGVRLQLQAHFRPCLHQPLCRGQSEEQIRLLTETTESRKKMSAYVTRGGGTKQTQTARRVDLLTDKVFHHLGGVVRSWSDAQQFIPPGDCGVVDRLNVDVVTTHHEVTHFSVFQCIRHLKWQMQQPSVVRTNSRLLQHIKMQFSVGSYWCWSP